MDTQCILLAVTWMKWYSFLFWAVTRLGWNEIEIFTATTTPSLAANSQQGPAIGSGKYEAAAVGSEQRAAAKMQERNCIALRGTAPKQGTASRQGRGGARETNKILGRPITAAAAHAATARRPRRSFFSCSPSFHPCFPLTLVPKGKWMLPDPGTAICSPVSLLLILLAL